MVQVPNLKKEFLELLERDVEFRYAVAGYLGLSEILKRLDSVEDSLRKLWEEVRGLREEQRRLWEGQNKLWESQNKLWEEHRKLWEEQKKLWEEVKGLREEQRKLWESQNKLWENQNKLWEEQRKLWEEVREVKVTLARVSTTLDRLTISVEEEALSYIKHRLRERLGVEVELDRTFVEGREVNIYGATNELCVIGEATVRLGTKLISELKEKVELIKARRPDLLRPKVVKVIYADYATPDALDYAKKEKIWVLKWSGDMTPLTVEET
ncbi:MAG: hypothetical protein QXJ99_02380 [Thermofilum sp.]